ncbi:conserved hypothetical protein [Treponema primitia ZAS-2]|uniref:DUF4116 domain-containing protein n=1 Tax=Treponema primitia (strain ATCC BAA-887 / DSM 12427 / ZAS-2) TaxID=545694 RepID=F5YL36_TREPZ|nr:hypothetical protein [Treponema primitia]AEF85615.1 conserved hypothetical protein [Treponema primitia ZAS-2]
MNNQDFLREYHRLMKKTVKFSHITRYKGHAEVLPLIDREKILGFDIFEYGLFLTGSGICDQDIEAGLTNLVEQEKDGDLQLLKRMQKEAILCLMRSDPTDTVKLVLESLLNTRRPSTTRFSKDHNTRYYKLCILVMRYLCKLSDDEGDILQKRELYREIINNLDDEDDAVLKAGLDLSEYYYYNDEEIQAVKIIITNIASREQDEWERRFKLAQGEAVITIVRYRNALKNRNHDKTMSWSQPNLYGLLIRLNSIMASKDDLISRTILAPVSRASYQNQTGDAQYDAETILRILIELGAEPGDSLWNYAFGISDNTEDDFQLCLSAVEQYGRALYLVKAERFSFEQYLKLCRAALKQNGMALEYVDKKVIAVDYFDLCRAAVQQDGIALGYIKGEKCTREQYVEICFLAIHQFETMRANMRYSHAYPKTLLYFVDTAVCTGEQYADICLSAIADNPEELEYIYENICPQDRYYEICLAAIKKDVKVLTHVNRPAIGKRYQELYAAAVKQDATAIRYAEERFLITLTSDQYFEICLTAVKKDNWVISRVKKEYLTAAQYFELCHMAVPEKSDVLRDMREEDCTAGDYFELCKAACPKDRFALGIINEHPLAKQFSASQYFDLCLLAVKRDGFALNYVQTNIGAPWNLSGEQYFDLCMAAMADDYGNALEYVKGQFITQEQYFELCNATISRENVTLDLEDFDPQFLNPDQYFEICMSAVQEGCRGNSKYIVDRKCTSAQYFEIYLTAAHSNEIVLRYIKDSIIALFTQEQYYEICLSAVQNDVDELVFVKEEILSTEQNQALFLAALKKDGNALLYMEKQTPEIWFDLIQLNGTVLEYIWDELYTNEEYMKLCCTAVEQTGEALVYVNIRRLTHEQYLTLCRKAVGQGGNAIGGVKKKYCTEAEYLELFHIAIKQDIGAVHYIEAWIPEICWAVIEVDGLVAARNIPLEVRTPEMRIAMVRQNGLALQHMLKIQEKIPELALAAVEQNGLALDFVVNQTPEIINAAIAQNSEAAKFIHNKETQNEPNGI